MPRLAHRAGVEKRVHAHGLRRTQAADVLAALCVLSAAVGAGLVRVVGERHTLLLGIAFGACGFAL
jgi:hypothetical protein